VIAAITLLHLNSYVIILVSLLFYSEKLFIFIFERYFDIAPVSSGSFDFLHWNSSWTHPTILKNIHISILKLIIQRIQIYQHFVCQYLSKRAEAHAQWRYYYSVFEHRTSITLELQMHENKNYEATVVTCDINLTEHEQPYSQNIFNKGTRTSVTGKVLRLICVSLPAHAQKIMVHGIIIIPPRKIDLPKRWYYGVRVVAKCEFWLVYYGITSIQNFINFRQAVLRVCNACRRTSLVKRHSWVGFDWIVMLGWLMLEMSMRTSVTTPPQLTNSASIILVLSDVEDKILWIWNSRLWYNVHNKFNENTTHIIYLLNAYSMLL
jgi:hypothetical protein